MSQIVLYPLLFEPNQSVSALERPALGDLLTAPLPNGGHIGEARLLSESVQT